MKYKIIILLFTTNIIQAQRVCEDYITDEWPDSRYTIQSISSDNVVTDNKTGLMWKQCSEGLSGAGCLTGTASKHTWQQALDSPVSLNVTSFAGFNDWRLPNIGELRSIAAINCSNPSINEIVFPNTPIGPVLESLFWSSSPFADFRFAWFVGFSIGNVRFGDRDSSYNVRLVRSGE